MWIGSGIGDLVVLASAKVLVSSLSAGALGLRPFTILRTRMQVVYESDQSGATERSFGSYGRIVVTDTASALGPTAVPDPGATTGDPDADWFVHQTVMANFDFVSGVGFHPVAFHSWTVDSKAMRKVGPNDDVVAMFKEENAVGGVLTTMGRTLIQLH